MKSWPAQYKILAVTTVTFAVAAMLIYIFLLRPLQADVAARQTAVNQQIDAIRERKWPVDPDAIAKLLERQKKRLQTLNIRLEEIQQRASGTFADRIQDKYGPDAIDDPDKFIHYASSLDYQVYYEEIMSTWRDKGVMLQPDILGLTDDSASEYIYQSVLQLWSLDQVLATVHSSGLTPVTKSVRIARRDEEGMAETVPPSAYRTVRATMIRLLPIREYTTDKDSETSFLLELPVRLTLRGSINQLESFLQRTNRRDALIPVSSVEIHKLPPTRRHRTNEILEIKLECSTFYPLHRERTAGRKEQSKPLPAGA